MENSNHLGGGPRMFNTLHGERALELTSKNLTNSDTTLATLVNKHGARRFWAGVKAQGLEPGDVDAADRQNEITVQPGVPAASVAGITAHRTKMWEDLRQARLREVDQALEEMKDDDVRRYWKCESGVNPINAKDLPPVDTLGGMDKFNEMQQRMADKIKAEQTRKAMALGLNFLMEKKKREEADAKVAASEKRIADYKRDQAEEWKARAAAGLKKQEKRKADSDRATKAKEEWCDQTEEALWTRFSGARARRTHRYSPEGLQAKTEAATAKRMSAFAQATAMEEQMLERLEDKRLDCEDRLAVRKLDIQERLDKQCADRQAAFQHKQVVIHAKTTEWVENKLESHSAYEAKCDASRTWYKNNLKEKSKSCSDIRKKTTDKVVANKTRLAGQQAASNDELIARHGAADVRREELNAMKYKNENDIFTYTEMKHHTFGELARRRNAEIKKRTAATHQAAIIRHAEKKVKGEAITYANQNLRNCRQSIGKESLTLMDRAAEGFLKIQCEPDESKVIATMNAMGFDMPKLPVADDEEEEGEKKNF